MNYQFNIGDQVIWRGGWGTRAPQPARIVDRGEKNDSPVYDLDNGHWAYEDQLDREEEPSRRNLLKAALILAITAPTENDTDKAIIAAEEIANVMDEREVREVQGEIELMFGGQS